VHPSPRQFEANTWGRPSKRGLRDEYTTEIHYKMQPTQRLALTPSVQMIVNPSNNRGTAVLGVFGICARIDF